MALKFNPITGQLDVDNVSSVAITGGNDGVNIISAGTQIANTSGTVKFANSNGLTFGMSNNSVVTASHNGLTSQTVQTQNMVSVQGSTGDISFANSNGLTFGGNNSTITASYTVPSTAGLISNINLSAGTTSQNLSKVTFNDSNGVSFGLNGSVITATVKTDYQTSGNYLTTARASNDAVGLNTAKTNVTWTVNSSGISLDGGAYLTSQTVQPVALSGSNGSFNFSTATFGNSNGLSFYTTNGSMVGSYTVPSVPAQTNQTIGVYGSSQTTGQSSSSTYDARSLTIRGAGNISVGNSGGEVIISATGGGAADGYNILAAGTQTANTTGSVKFADSNGISFGMSNSSQVTASYTVPSTAGLISAINLSAGTTSNNLSKVTFNDSNGISFGLNGSVVTATVKTDYQSSNANYLTSQSNQALSGSNGSFNFQTATFGNLNGMSFYTSNGSMVGSYTVPTVTNSSWTVSDAVTSASVGRLAFTNSNGLTLSLSTSNNGNHTVIGSYTVPTISSATLSDANTSVTLGRLAFTNSNGLTLALSTSNNGNHTLTGSYTVPSTAGLISAINLSAGTTSNNLSKLTFADSNGISFGLSGNSVVTATVKTDYQSSNANYLTSQSNQALSGSNGSFTFQTATFGSSNGMHFYSTNGSLVGSYTVPTVTDYFSKTNTTFNGTNVSGSLTLNTNGLRVDLSAGAGGGAAISGGANSQNTGTVNFANSNGVSFGLSNNGTMTASFSAPAVSNSAGSFTWQTLNFSNANNVTWGTSAGSIVTASVAAPGAAAENNNHNLLGANTAGNTTASGSTIGLSGINLTLSGTNGSAINISAPATSSLSATGQVSISTNGSTISIGVPAALTVSRYNEFKESPLVAGQQGRGTLHLQPWIIPNLHMDRVIIHVNLSNASNSSGSGSFSNWIGLYTKNVSTLSLLASTSASTAVTMSGTVGSYSLYGGFRQHSIGWTNTLTAGMYWIGVINSSTTGGANMSYSQMLNSQINTNFSGQFGVASNATNALSLGFGVYTAATAGLPATINFNQINGTASLALRPPSVFFVSGSQ